MTQPQPLPNLVGYAVAYARRGWPVFPLHTAYGKDQCSCGKDCGHAGKHPRTAHGLNDATTDEATIRGWWQQWPDAGIGIAVGKAKLVVVDIDPRSGGTATWSSLVTQHDCPVTTCVRTGGGGEHLFFRGPGYPVQSKSGALGHGVDIKSDGGYVVAPPTRHESGERYEWRQGAGPGDGEPAPCPQWVLERLQRKRDRGSLPDSLMAQAFANAGKLGRRLPDGRWSVECPWRSTHSDSGQRWRDTDSSTVLLPATSEHPSAKFHCSHAHCSGRTSDDAIAALPVPAVEAARGAWQGRVDSSAPVPDDTWQAELRRNGKGELVACEANVDLILAHDDRIAGKLRWDAFASKLRWAGKPPWQGHTAPTTQLPIWQDADAHRLVGWLHTFWGIRVATTIAHAAAEVAGRANESHPVLEYLDGLRWDGVVRCDRWLATYLGAEDSVYMRSIGPRWLISAVARVRDPGCQVDHMLVLEGPQGRRKSTALRCLASPGWYTDRLSDPSKKDSAEELPGVWIAEFSDLATLRRADVESIKAFVSRRTDRYRPSYGRCVVEQPRQCVFAGSTNEQSYLADATGARRFWPVACGDHIDVEGIERDRDQLWAEAVARYESGESWWLDTEQLVAEAAGEQDDRYIGDPWTGPVAEWLESSQARAIEHQRGGIETTDVLSGAIGLEKGKWDRAAQTRVGAIVGRLGWPRVRVRKNGSRLRVYVRPGSEWANQANLETDF
jgi:predicted P-loop ATPase